MSESHTDLALRQTVVAGAAAGDVTVTGIKTTDKLKAVIDLTAPADLTSEFTISAANTINNTGGTSSAGSGPLLVTYIASDDRGGDLNRD